ncbi:hypothetical protein BDV06DRAFT_230853 [Aspergillus oleicola]
MFSSHTSSSASSSPDVLAPPGDADYLISSPFRPFAGRQSSLMSPANRRILQTPGAAKRKRSRISLSPAKSAHSIRFDDIVLPGSPTRNLNGRQRSLSPDKQDGNVSPWRIRVTLEATQDEDQEDQGSPSRKRSRPLTTTTKVPLKDGSEQTPRRGRGRPPKSGAHDTTPRAGSPGNTPGPGNTPRPGHTPGPGNTPGPLNSGQKRRGRPPKNRPVPDPIDNDQRPEQLGQGEGEAPVVDTAPTGTELERRSWSPLNLAGDADSDDGFDDNPPLDIPFEPPAQTELADMDEQNPQQAFEQSFDTPNGDAIDRFYPEQGDDNLHSTPSKMPSPTRSLRSRSRENSIHAGHTPMPPRASTPSSSSLVDDERKGRSQPAPEQSATASKPTAVPSDPASEYREFDTIVESEGFSMVSLDTLPSVKQHTLQTSSKLAKGALKPFIEREQNGVLGNKTNKLDHSPKETSVHSPVPDPIPSAERRSNFSQPKSSPIPQRRPPLRLAKFIRVGIALGRVLSHSNPPTRPGESVPDYMEPRQRLDVLFSDLNPDSQRLLGAALWLGQVLAIRRKYMELRSPQRRALFDDELEKEDDLRSPRFEYTRQNMSRTPNRQYDGADDSSPPHSSPSTEMKRRFAEWQKERDAISNTIRMANDSQVIVINSDTGTPSSVGRHHADNMNELGQSPWKPLPEEHQDEMEADYDIEPAGAFDAEETPRIPRQQEEWQQEDSEDEDYGVDGVHYDARRSPTLSKYEEEYQEEREVEEEEEEDEEEEEEEEEEEVEYDNQGMRRDYGAQPIPGVLGQEEHQDEDGYVNDEEKGSYNLNRSLRIPRQFEQIQEEFPEDYGNEDQGYNDADGDDDDDGYEDIWQDEAKYEGNSDRISTQESQGDAQSCPRKGGSTPAERGYNTASSPGYWLDGQGKFLGPSRIRDLREKEGDVFAILREEDTPNRARYYYGKSSPLSSAKGRSPQHLPSSATSQRPQDAERYEAQPDDLEEPEDYLNFSPEKDLEDDEFLIDPTTRHESEMQRHQSDFADNASVSDMSEESVHEESLTPKNPEPANKDVPASSWFQRITNFTPGWLKAPVHDAPAQNASPQPKYPSLPTSRESSKEPSIHEEHAEEEDEEEEAEAEGESMRKPQEPSPEAESESDIEQRPSLIPEPKPTRASQSPNLSQKANAAKNPPPLATSGYFSNAHYTLLRRLYRLAKQSPESFPPHTSSTHADIIGDYIWTSDDTYGVPITELQFAIVYRFRQEVAAQDLAGGGSGWVAWTDADLHRRLISVIIGEQIREDRKSANSEMRPSRSRPRSIIQRG